MRRTIAALTAALAVGSVVAPQAGAEPAPPTLEATFPVAPGIVRELRSWSTPGGPQRLQILRFASDDPRVSLRPELAGGIVPGREPVAQTVLNAGPNAVAGVNGGFWLTTPDGDPEGLVIQDGRYVSEPATRGNGPRAAFALFDDGSWAVGRPDHHEDVWFPSGASARLFGINRLTPEDGVTAMNSGWGPRTDAPDDAVEAVFDTELRPNTLASHRVEQVRAAGGPLVPGRTVLVGRGSWAEELASLEPGDVVTFDLRSSRPWNDAVQALAAGPLLIEDAARVPRDQWETEGFEHRVHNDRAHPRTIIGFTASGEVMLVTVDGRQPGSAGLTTDEAIDLMVALGAVDAMMLDGGGSTTMAVDGRITNQPCCDDPGHRYVSNSLVLRSSVETPAVDRLAGDDRYATAAAIAAHGWPGGAPRVFLASGRNFPDGLAGGPFAAAQNAPVLLTAPDALPAATRDALTALSVTHVTILGGPSAIGEDVEADLVAQGVTVDRIAGEDRFATAAAVARNAGGPTTRAVLANGRGFADALAAVVPAAAAGAPLLLTEKETLPEPTRSALQDLGITDVLIAGGPAVVSDAIVAALTDLGIRVERAAGQDRYATAVALVQWAEQTVGLEATTIAIASGADFPDALAGGAYAASVEAPVLLSQHTSLEVTGPPAAWLDGRSLDRGLLFGGRLALSTWIAHELQAAADRP